MVRNTLVVGIVMLALVCVPATTWACTTILVTKGASADGSVIVAHSDDDELGDQRIVHVPAADHAPGTMRPVYPGLVGFPRYVGTSRGPAYNIPGYTPTQPIGYIPQVPHTYAYFDGNYGIMNEHQLLIGECTNAANVNLKPEVGVRIMCVEELSRIALERCTKARDAVQLMGDLAVQYGYYEWGETLLVADTEEGWVFDICGTPNGTSALWVATRVPDGEVFAAANEFRTREIDTNDPNNVLYSPNLFTVTQAAGWYDPNSGPLDWLRTVSPGEYNHPYYSLRRVWRIMDRLAPALNLSPWVEDGYTKAYPFSVKPEKKLTVRDVMSLYRDHYEGTEFDMSQQNLASGPFGTPTRYIGPYDGAQNQPDSNQTMFGAWERPISVFYCGYTYVLQARSWLPDEIGGVAWVGLDVSYTTCFVPFYAGATDLPESYQTGSTDDFDHDAAWWAFNFVANWAELKFQYMIKDIQATQKQLEDREFVDQVAVETMAQTLYDQDPNTAREYLTDYGIDNADDVVSEWWEMANDLVQKYDDGYINDPVTATEVGYPKEWLDQVGYDQGPTTYNQPGGLCGLGWPMALVGTLVGLIGVRGRRP
ncbi:MAG: C69 family dipeptidase [Phycisphaerae bacterium]|nr:C69 family dipeptidase [Phycisphaerae bacterium]